MEDFSPKDFSLEANFPESRAQKENRLVQKIKPNEEFIGKSAWELDEI